MERFFARLILISSSQATPVEKIGYSLEAIVKLAPVAYVLSMVQWWFSENKQFGEFMCIALIINMGVGVWFHLKAGTFKFPEFIWKNLGMVAIVICGYMMLEMLRYTAGDNLAGELFRVLIQITTLLYPGSKIMKNLFILSNKKFPPEFIMQKLYNFEKNGDLHDFFNNKKDEE